MSMLPAADPTFSWQEALAALAVITIAAFLVTWLVTDVRHVRREPYVAVLTAVTAGLGAGYALVSGTSWVDLLTWHWEWGVVGGVVVAGIFTPAVRRLPANARPGDGGTVASLLWEGAVYGIAEGVLLATLPVLATSHALTDLGWTDGAWGAVATGTFAIAASLVVILVHHLGYRTYRTSTMKLTVALVGCGVQALAFVVTGSVLAPAIAHVVLHAELIVHGDELPPERGAAAVVHG